MNALKIGMEKSKFQGREDTMKLIEALEGLEMKEGDDFPQGDKVLRKEDHQAFLREFIFEVKDGKHQILDVIAEGEDDLPAGLQVRLSDRPTRPSTTPPRPTGRGGAAGPCAPHRGPDHPLWRPDRAQQRQLRGRSAARSAPSSGRTAPARAPSSIA